MPALLAQWYCCYWDNGIVAIGIVGYSFQAAIRCFLSGYVFGF